jgi:hypothetical protein
VRSEFERDIERIDAIFEAYGLRLHAEAWRRLRARLKPDRERVARAIHADAVRQGAYSKQSFDELDAEVKERLCEVADAVINAMGEP